MKIKQNFYGVHVVTAGGEPFLALGGNEVPALFNSQRQAQSCCRILVKGGAGPARVVRVKATFKIKGAKR